MRRLLWLGMLLAAGLLSGPAGAEKRVDVEEQLRMLERGELPRLEIPDARYRVGVFAFEDPDRTGVGNALAAILGREILVKSEVGSIGVLRFEGGLSPPAGGGQSYFDKVESVSAAQQVTLALWGTIQRSGKTIRVDTYLEIPATTLDPAFRWSVHLPGESGGGVLVAHAGPDRMLLQESQFSVEALPALRNAASVVDVLRERPSDSAPVVARLPAGSVYWVDQEKGEWIHVDTGQHGKGWARVSGHCGAECTPLLDAARFAAGLLQFMQDRRIPEAPDSLTPDARALSDQVAALESLAGKPEQVKRDVLLKTDAWVRPGTNSAGLPPGGAGFANIRALGMVVISAQLAQRARAPMPVEEARNIAFELAEASLLDPKNPDVLNNLATLFAYVGDERRAALARSLAPPARIGRRVERPVGHGERRD